MASSAWLVIEGGSKGHHLFGGAADAGPQGIAVSPGASSALL